MATAFNCFVLSLVIVLMNWNLMLLSVFDSTTNCSIVVIGQIDITWVIYFRSTCFDGTEIKSGAFKSPTFY
jgi:hypothetical protein